MIGSCPFVNIKEIGNLKCSSNDYAFFIGGGVHLTLDLGYYLDAFVAGQLSKNFQCGQPFTKEFPGSSLYQKGVMSTVKGAVAEICRFWLHSLLDLFSWGKALSKSGNNKTIGHLSDF